MSMEIVNGYVCHNCTDVDYAKKNIDPAHPKDGPNGVNKAEREKEAGKAQASATGDPDVTSARGPAVMFGGALAGLQLSTSTSPPPSALPVGSTFSLRV